MSNEPKIVLVKLTNKVDGKAIYVDPFSINVIGEVYKGSVIQVIDQLYEVEEYPDMVIKLVEDTLKFLQGIEPEPKTLEEKTREAQIMEYYWKTKAEQLKAHQETAMQALSNEA